jgi:flagellar protein FlaF
MFRDSRRAYESGARSATTNRELESAALSKAARQLDDVRRAWAAADRPRRLEEALTYNRRLWTFFQGELAASDHPMPRELRVDILRLSAFVDRRTMEVFADPQPQKLAALIEINRQLAAGLAAREPGAAAA